MKLPIDKTITHFEFWKYIPTKNAREDKETEMILINDQNEVTRLESLLSKDMHETHFHDGFTTSRYELILYSGKTRLFALEVINKLIKSDDDRFYYSPTRELWNFLENVTKEKKLKPKKISLIEEPCFIRVPES
jgi:hypothetical protein